MLAARRESEFAAGLDRLVEAFPQSLRLTQFWASFYGEINRETKYFDALVRLFDLNLAENQLAGACDAIDKLIEIDPYDSRNQQRLDQLKGRASDDFLSRVKSRMSNAATHRPEVPVMDRRRGKNDEPSTAILRDVQSGQTLEDLLVQAEIFVQYSLQSKAVERLQRIVELFPGEEEHNERLQGLFEAAHWQPAESALSRKRMEPFEPPFRNRPTAIQPRPSMRLKPCGTSQKFPEINQNVFWQPSPRAMLSVAVNDVGNYLRVSRCLAVVGPPGQPPQMASEFCASGFEASSRQRDRSSDRPSGTRRPRCPGRVAAGSHCSRQSSGRWGWKRRSNEQEGFAERDPLPE